MQDKSPNQKLAQQDTGAEVQSRFRYQASVAALFCLELMNADSNIEAVFCEHHEDILLMYKDNTYEGIQVKTREQGLDLLKADEEVILHSINNFIKKDSEFPQKFSGFTILTNYSFWMGQKDGKNLSFIIELCKMTNLTKGKKVLNVYIKKLKNGISEKNDKYIEVLKKVRLMDNSKFSDIRLKIANSLKDITFLKNKTSFQLLYLADRLTDFCLEASSYTKSTIKNPIALLLKTQLESEEQELINYKKIDRQKLEPFLRSLVLDNILPSRENISIKNIPPGFGIIELKMSEGNIGSDDIEIMKDHKFQTEHKFIELEYKDQNFAQDKYETLYSIAKTECQEAYSETYKNDESFGNEMLKNLRIRLRERYKLNHDAFPEFMYEHYCGMSGILIEACLAWFSDKFEVK